MTGPRLQASDSDGVALVFAATGECPVDRRMGRAAAGGTFAHIADAAQECGCVVPARLERGGGRMATATGGRSPRLRARVAEDSRLDFIEGVEVPGWLSVGGRRGVSLRMALGNGIAILLSAPK